MKAILSFCIFSFLSLNWVQAQNVYIPDANFKSALITIGIDTNSDGEIQLTEAQAVVTDLNLNNKNISDLTGIKSFTNVINLYCGPNNLTTADLSGMVNIRHVYLGDNALTSINVNGMTNLRYLSCGNNQLSAVNLDGLLYLRHLNLSNNQFSSLQISNLPSLENFHFMFNNVSATLAFSAVPLLEVIYANNSHLTSINLSNLNALKILNCNSNQLSSLSFQDGVLQNMQFLSVTDNPMQFVCKDSYDLLPNTDPVPQLTNACILATIETAKEQGKLTITPNPAKEYINLNHEVNQIKIFNWEGKIVLNKKDNKEIRIDISDLPTGMYILTTELGNVKFLKQ